MDPVSQGALGALAAASITRNSKVRQGAIIGCAAGMLPDADIFISSGKDPLLCKRRSKSGTVVGLKPVRFGLLSFRGD